MRCKLVLKILKIYPVSLPKWFEFLGGGVARGWIIGPRFLEKIK
jgi:hypothetical protein